MTQKIKLNTVAVGAQITDKNLFLDATTGELSFAGKSYTRHCTNLRKIKPYLYETTYEGVLNYQKANEYFKSVSVNTAGACSAVRSGNFIGRNYDWFYDHSVSFIVHTERFGNRFKSVGVGNLFREGTKQDVEAGNFPILDRILPFSLLDGINENGVFAEINILPSELPGNNVKSVPRVEEREEICALMLPRYVCDYADSATQIVNYIADYVSIYSPDLGDGKFHEFHYMVADDQDTYILEVINGEVNIFNCNSVYPKVLTNFSIGVCSLSGSIIDPWTTTDHGMGIERYILARDIVEDQDFTSKGQMLELMGEKLKYTNSYLNQADPVWYTEFCDNYGGSIGDLTILDARDNPSKFEPVMTIVNDRYQHRTREMKNTWQTVYSSVYDIPNRKIYVLDQECPVADFTEVNLNSQITEEDVRRICREIISGSI